MRRLIAAFLALASIVCGSPTVFSVHDDLLAFPQYEVVFSENFISDVEAQTIVERASSKVQDPPPSANTKNIEVNGGSPSDTTFQPAFNPSHETYELMYLNGETHLCAIPVVNVPPKNETSAAEEKLAEQKELTRATDRGWELLQDLEGQCLYFISGYWSYSFCYNAAITQFHQLPPQPGKPLLPPQRDPETKQFVLGRSKTNDGKDSKEDEWGNQVEVHKAKQVDGRPKTELQVKGDSRYLVQKMEGGTTCDLTGKPRRVEVQFHCNPNVGDRIGYIKEVTTCSYLMVVYTPKLCNDIAFQPPKENKAHAIVCRIVVPEEDVADRTELQRLTALEESQPVKDKPIDIGGVIVGAGKWINKEGQRMPIPKNFGQEDEGGKVVKIIARGESKSDGGQVEKVSDAELRKLDLEPEMVDQLKKEVQKMAKEKGWKIEVVDQPGAVREILGIVDGEDEFEGEDGDRDGEEGSEEVFYKDEL